MNCWLARSGQNYFKRFCFEFLTQIGDDDMVLMLANFLGMRRKEMFVKYSRVNAF